MDFNFAYIFQALSHRRAPDLDRTDLNQENVVEYVQELHCNLGFHLTLAIKSNNFSPDLFLDWVLFQLILFA